MLTIFDCSNYTGELDADLLDCLQRLPVDGGIVRCSLETPEKTALAQRQIAAIRSRFSICHGYPWCYGTDDPLSFAQAVQGAFDLGAYWLDVEDGASFGALTNQQSIDWLQTALSGFQGPGMGIYTAEGPWFGIMGQTQQFAAYPLWWANPNGVPDVGGNYFRPFGGWQQAEGHQYFWGPVCGRAIDLSMLREPS